MKRSHVLVLPSVQDNHPFSIMKTQVTGKIVVASNAGGIPEMVPHNQTGFIIPARNSDELACRLNYIFSNPDVPSNIEGEDHEKNRLFLGKVED
ncbi:glycosyltransferase [Brevibacillus ruminantium]|uniref:Glycosyltransferase n=1 Tax=Brevibacillus ruminantium TaxID=2950604 RepID=A0ABY4WM52_9BACL|nr:glycosyltransferase [Brevibacillus ruminantium]USG68248.1 glycosyltransferase [Brevibacillus ruminantium]